MKSRTRAGAEIAICCAVFLLSWIWSTRCLNIWISQGGRPQFYQENFEPSVMIACGYGFSTTIPQPRALAAFLEQRLDRLACSDVAPGPGAGRGAMFQRPWFYLIWFVGLAWTILGVSWSGLAPAFGFLFGAAIVLVYGVCRLAMGRVLSLVAAFGVSTSSLHLVNMPHLRDFAKEPFTLALFLILGLLVTRPVTFRRVVSLAGAYGVVLGVAYGFRSDFLVDIPLLIVVLALFLEGGPLRHIRTKLAAGAAFAAAFVVVGWPEISAVYREGGCQWHAAILGLQEPFDPYLVVSPAPYGFGYNYADAYVYDRVKSFARRTVSADVAMTYCSPEYDVQSARYLRVLVRTFPADFVTRAYASARSVAEAPFLMLERPVARWMTSFFVARGNWLRPFRGAGIWFIALTMVLVAARSLRLGLFVMLFTLYLGGYPAIQFAPRHFFHLEFAVWWAFGFVVQRAFDAIRALWPLEWSDWRQLRACALPIRTELLPWWELAYLLRRCAAFFRDRWRSRSVNVTALRAAAVRGAGALACAAVLLVTTVWVLRVYQTPRARLLLESYVATPKTPLERSQAGAGNVVALAVPSIGTSDSDLIEIDVDRSRCGPDASLTFTYDAARMPTLTHEVAIPAAAKPGITRVFMAVFGGFTGVTYPQSMSDCVTGGYRLADPRALPLMVDATLPPGWESRPLYQRFTAWEPHWIDGVAPRVYTHH